MPRAEPGAFIERCRWWDVLAADRPSLDYGWRGDCGSWRPGAHARGDHAHLGSPSLNYPRLTSPVLVSRLGARLARFTRLDRDRDGLLVFFVGVVLLSVAAAVYFLTNLLVAAAPVVMLARRVTIAGPTSNAPRRVVGQWGGAGGAGCEDHFLRNGRREVARVDTMAGESC